MKRKIEPMHDEHINVTPLIDVIMCLIIFFLLCGQLAKDQSLANIKVPVAQRGKDLPEKVGEVVINVAPQLDADGRPRVGQAPDYIVRGVSYNKDTLSQFLRKEVSQNKDLKLVVRADQAQQYQYVEPVLVAAASAKIGTINFVTSAQQ